ncbi:MAG: exonuclease SbcCD subunit D [Candidatus Dormibacteraeota bacterium]|nr:exonuclease SbcCD subunit D [Candidatus Dormibacteraeota bacterium]
MRIMHTADWHLGARIGTLRRIDDQLAQVERVLELCDENKADVLLVAGDVFEVEETDDLEAIMKPLSEMLQPRLSNGLSVLLLPGNHDHGSAFPLLERAQRLGGTAPSGTPRVFFRARPANVSRVGRDGNRVQFLLLPWPRPSTYLDGSEPLMAGPALRAHLAQAWRNQVAEMTQTAKESLDQPIVLASHILVSGADIGTGYRLTEQDDVPVAEADIPSFSYVALGHIHKPQTIGSRRWVRYSGAIERMDMGEKDHDRGVVFVEIGADGRLVQDPEFLELPACPFYRVAIDGSKGMEGLADRYADQDPTRAYVEVTLNYDSAEDNTLTIERDLRRVFPRMYRLHLQPIGEGVQVAHLGDNHHDVATTARTYVAEAIEDDVRRVRVLTLLDELLEEVVA